MAEQSTDTMTSPPGFNPNASPNVSPSSPQSASSSPKKMDSVITSALSTENLHQHTVVGMREQILRKYDDDISAGAVCFWCIPTAEGDSQYVAFLLEKQKKMAPYLERAVSLARNLIGPQMRDPLDIREWPLQRVNEQDQWVEVKAKGLLFDCGSSFKAVQVNDELKRYLLKLQNDKMTEVEVLNCNFSRLVLHRFGARFFAVQSVPKKNRVKLPKDLRTKPQGPKLEKGIPTGEPSVKDMVLESQQRGEMMVGEYDHSSIAPTDMDALSVNTGMTVETNMTAATSTKFHSMGHMKYGGLPPPTFSNSMKRQQPGWMSQSASTHYGSDRKEDIQMMGNQERPFTTGDMVMLDGTKWKVRTWTHHLMILQSGGYTKHISNEDFHRIRRL